MTTFKPFRSVDTAVSWSYSQLTACIFIFSIFSSFSMYSQHNAEIIQRHHKVAIKQTRADKSGDLPSQNLISNSESAEINTANDITDNGEENQRIEVDLAVDMDRNDGIDMFMSGYGTRGSSKIIFEIDFAQAGHTIVQVLDGLSGEVLFIVFDKDTKAGKEVFEIDQNDIRVESFIVLATHTGGDGQIIKASLEFVIPGMKEEPLGIEHSSGKNIVARMTPTLGRGIFQIDADFKYSAFTTAIVYDLNGRVVDTLFSGYCKEGSVTFNGNSSNYLGGTYIVTVQSGRDIWTRKMIVQ